MNDAEEAFSQAIGNGKPRLFVLIITHSGKAYEEPLGKVKPWDLVGKAQQVMPGWNDWKMKNSGSLDETSPEGA